MTDLRHLELAQALVEGYEIELRRNRASRSKTKTAHIPVKDLNVLLQLARIGLAAFERHERKAVGA